MVHMLLKPGLENFEHYFTSLWEECNCAVVWAFFGIAFLWDWNEKWPFPVCCHCWVFQICWHIECSTFTGSSFRNWNSSAGIHRLHYLCSSWHFLRRTWLHIPGCLALGDWSHHYGYQGHEDLFCILLCYSCHLLLISSASVRSISFLCFICPSLHEMFLGISNFLEETSSLSHSIVFLYLNLC